MDNALKIQLKQLLKNAIKNYFKRVKIERNYQMLDLIFPIERRIRSVIGGLETSLGTSFWEPVAKILAQSNGFTVITDKVLIPDPFPPSLLNELNNLIDERENKPSGKTITTEQCINRLKNVSSKIKWADSIVYKAPPRGTGIDIHLSKDGKEYAFDLKTAQPNQGDLQKYNRQLLKWYAYKFVTSPHANFQCRIAIPFNPFSISWYKEQDAKLSESPLDVDADIWVGNEFWDFCSGTTDTLTHLESIFRELGEEKFSEEFSDYFYRS